MDITSISHNFALTFFRQYPRARQQCLSSCLLSLCTHGCPPRCWGSSCPLRLLSSAPSITPSCSSWPGLGALPLCASPCCSLVSMSPCTCFIWAWGLEWWPFWSSRVTKWLTVMVPIRKLCIGRRNWRVVTPIEDWWCLAVTVQQGWLLLQNDDDDVVVCCISWSKNSHFLWTCFYLHLFNECTAAVDFFCT